MKKTRYLTIISILSALAMVLMYFRFPLPIFPSFYELDFSNVVVVLGGYVCGPVAAIIIEVLKNLLKILFQSTNSAFVGDLANVIMGLAFTLPAVYIYRKKPNTKGVIVGLVVGTLTAVIVSCFVNYFVLIPLYANMYNMPVESIIEMGTALNASVTSLFTFIVLLVAPFNLIKGVCCSVVAYLVYKAAYVIFKPYEVENS